MAEWLKQIKDVIYPVATGNSAFTEQHIKLVTLVFDQTNGENINL